eukprot:1080596-Lingulodinium_polyedra.AAC.1
MECEWKNSTGHEHRSEVHNGDMLDDPNQLQRMYSELRDSKGKSQFTGREDAAFHPSASSSLGQRQKGVAEAAPSAAASRVEEDESEVEEDEEEDMMDLLMDGVGDTKRPRSG